MPKEQQEMFSQRDIAQFGVNARPQLPLSPTMPLELSLQDPRTAEEKRQDQQEQEKLNTIAMFPEESIQASPETTLRKELVRQAMECGQVVMGMLEELMKQPSVSASYFGPALLKYTEELAATIRELAEPEKSNPKSSPNRRQLRLGSKSSHTVLLIDGVRIIRPL